HEGVQPPARILLADAVDQRLLSFLPLLKRHSQRATECAGHVIAIKRVYDQRFVQLFSSTSEFRQNQNAWIVHGLGGDIFLGDKVHGIAERRDEAYLADAEEGGKRISRYRAVNVAHRGPVEVGEATVDRAGQRLQLLTDVDIGFHFLAGRRRDL